MKYVIDKDRVRKIVYLYLDENPKLVGIKKHKVNPYLYEFHKWNENDEELYELDPPFRYYEKGFFELNDLKDKSNLVISNELFDDITETFGDDNIFMELVKDWFVDKFNLPVNNFEY